MRFPQRVGLYCNEERPSHAKFEALSLVRLGVLCSELPAVLPREGRLLKEMG